MPHKVPRTTAGGGAPASATAVPVLHQGRPESTSYRVIAVCTFDTQDHAALETPQIFVGLGHTPVRLPG